MSKKLESKPIFEKQKLKNYWLRIYALKVESKYYIITGGAIKQSQNMKDHPDTDLQLKNMNRCNDFLKENGVTDIQGLFELTII